MKTVRLGKTGLQVSKIGFGGIPIQRLSQEEAVRVVRHCLELGVTFIDTANGYSTSEERIGQAIAGQREGLVIATKTGARDKAGALEHLELSLKRLNTDYIDLWQFHNVSTPEAYEQVLGPDGAMEAAQAALQAGQIRHIGISSHSMETALRAVASGHFETLQFPFNFVAHEPSQKLLPLAVQEDVGFIAMKPMGGGLLENARVAFKYLLQFENVVPDPGIERVEEIEEIIQIASGDREMTPQEREEMAQIRERLGMRFCRRCDYCQPCPQEISISTVLNIKSVWKRLPVESLATGWAARAMAGVERCIECGDCEEKCPYDLPIREMLKENQAFYARVVGAA